MRGSVMTPSCAPPPVLPAVSAPGGNSEARQTQTSSDAAPTQTASDAVPSRRRGQRLPGPGARTSPDKGPVRGPALPTSKCVRSPTRGPSRVLSRGSRLLLDAPHSRRTRAALAPHSRRTRAARRAGEARELVSPHTLPRLPQRRLVLPVTHIRPRQRAPMTAGPGSPCLHPRRRAPGVCRASPTPRLARPVQLLASPSPHSPHSPHCLRPPPSICLPVPLRAGSIRARLRLRCGPVPAVSEWPRPR